MIHGFNAPFSGAFSMGTAKRSSLADNNDTPGPGTYSPSANKGPRYPFPKAERKALYNLSAGPDPGSYEIQLKSVGPAYKFPKQQSPQQKPNLLGPGAYSTSVEKNQGFTFQSKFEMTANESLKYPGPGSYEVTNQRCFPKKNVGFTTSTRLSINNPGGPGPGQYKELPEMGASIKFPQSVRDQYDANKTPGPGSYQLRDSLNKGTSFAPPDYVRKAYKHKDEGPGPGSYEISSAKNQGVKIGSSKRAPQLNGSGPSPLEYNPNNYKVPSKKAVIGKGLRTDISKSNQTPGPGQYQAYTTLTTKGVILGKAGRDSHDSQQLPGPGRYNPNDSVTSNKSPSYHIAQKYDKPEQLLFNPSQTTLTGPGRYNLNRDLNDGPSYKFGLDEKHKEDTELNRSVFYDIQGSIGSLPTYLQNSKVI